MKSVRSETGSYIVDAINISYIHNIVEAETMGAFNKFCAPALPTSTIYSHNMLNNVLLSSAPYRKGTVFLWYHRS